MGNGEWGIGFGMGFWGAWVQMMLRHRMSTLFRLLSKTMVRTATKVLVRRVMAAKGGPLAARSPYQPPNKRSSSIEARPQAKHPRALHHHLRFVTKRLQPYVTNVSTGS
jgi:hypothetical protein